MLRLTVCKAARQVKGVASTLRQRSYADAAVAKQFDWDALAQQVFSDEGKRELAQLKSTWQDLTIKLSSEKAPAPIDWNYWKKEVDPQLVQEFESAYKSLKLPKYEISKDVQEAEAKFSELLAKATELEAQSKKRIQDIEHEIQDVQRERERISKVTVDEELQADPALAKEIDQEISEGKFMP